MFNLFAIFDGHGGDQVSKYCSEHFLSTMQGLDAYKNKDYKEALRETFKLLDQAIKKDVEKAGDCGSTACVVLLTKEKIYCANAGDSRAIMYSDGAAVALSKDHKPLNEDEKARIEAAGSFVLDGRVNHSLAVSRAFGDHNYKKEGLEWDKTAVSCFPDITEFENTAAVTFVFLACDGVWDCLSNDQLAKRVMELDSELKMDEYGLIENSISLEKIMDEILAPDTKDRDGKGCDNMSAIVAFLKH